MQELNNAPGLFAGINELYLYRTVQVIYALAGTAYLAHLVVRRTSFFGQLATMIFGAGLIAHLLLLMTRGLQAGHPPWMNFYEAVMTVAFVAGATYFVLERFTGLRIIGPFATGLVSLLLIHGMTLPQEFHGGNLMPALRDTFWRTIHVPTGMVSYGAFFISMVATALYVRKRGQLWGWLLIAGLALATLLVLVQLLRAASTTNVIYAVVVALLVFVPLLVLLTNKGQALLPSEDSLDTAIYRTIGFAYPFQFLLLITGAAWANEAWGRWWGWDQKETWAFVTFIVYTLYLHVRLMRGSKGWASGLSLLGALSVAITFWGVSFFPAIASQFHSYAKPQGTEDAAAAEKSPGEAGYGNDGGASNAMPEMPPGLTMPEGHPDISTMEPKPGSAPPLEMPPGALPPGHPPIGNDTTTNNTTTNNTEPAKPPSGSGGK